MVDCRPCFPLLGRIMANGTTTAIMIAAMPAVKMEMHQHRLREDFGKRAISRLSYQRNASVEFKIQSAERDSG